MAQQKAFSLVEVIAATTLLAIVASAAIPSYFSYVRRGRALEANTNLKTIARLQESYFTEHGVYLQAPPNPPLLPTNGERQKIDVSMPGWRHLDELPVTETFFQYEIVAGSARSLPAEHLSSKNCRRVGRSEATFDIAAIRSELKSLPKEPWYIATAIGDQDGDNECSLFIRTTGNKKTTRQRARE